MTLVPHRDGYRRIWQFPRNIRRIYPWKMGQILLLLSKMGATDWASDQRAQDEFCKALEKQGWLNSINKIYAAICQLKKHEVADSEG